MLLKRRDNPRMQIAELEVDGEGSLLSALRDSSTAAMASDARGRVVFWNRAAERMFSRPASGSVGRRCHDLVQARDVFGNRFCSESCPVIDMARRREAIRPFEWQLAGSPGAATRTSHVQILRLPGEEPGDYMLVHLLEPIDDDTRLSRLLSILEARPPASPALGPRPVEGRAGPSSSPPLTRRERQVLGCIARGLQNKEIAGELRISLATVRNHVHAILEKLEVHSKLEALSLAVRQGWTDARSGPSA